MVRSKPVTLATASIGSFSLSPATPFRSRTISQTSGPPAIPARLPVGPERKTIPGTASIRRPSSIRRSATRALDSPRRSLRASSIATTSAENRAENDFVRLASDIPAAPLQDFAAQCVTIKSDSLLEHRQTQRQARSRRTSAVAPSAGGCALAPLSLPKKNKNTLASKNTLARLAILFPCYLGCKGNIGSQAITSLARR